MRAVQVTKFGGPEVLSVIERPDPEPRAGEVLVKMAAVDVLFLDTKLRQGWGREYFDMNPPYVPGDGVAGDVVALGEGVDPAWLGKTVVASTENSGTCAELVAVPTGELVVVPDGLDEQAAAVLLHDAVTALQLADHAAVRPGEKVLVAAAAGGAASIIVQLTAAAGAHVIGAARGDEKLGRVRALGAEPVDYGAPDWAERVRDLTGGVDVLFDGAGGHYGRDAFRAVGDGGRVIAYGASDGDFADIDTTEAGRRGVTVTGLLDIQHATRERRLDLLRKALAEAAAGRITPAIGGSFPLEEVADAHAAIERREISGRAVLRP
ncbi:zinc-binding dehydrogenase [Saccharopolyspora sp. TS4A08]|uniref:Zinc-binding dehydrogenase n=1 Tax=Saccharopolyspora ipomoeae TaxID=3042027 RepID=A0ABT6PLA3_9PSEU|nr:zinc-binding dehydrogenase [Saccharopolyspora sp. TS4A08]MDI2028788.1 zinc-binding dehydrogenase [Saccharopolyspora sp. TS4A08]